MANKAENIYIDSKHDEEVLPCVKTLYILFRTDIFAKFKNFSFVKQIY